jgi:hypothetical protein
MSVPTPELIRRPAGNIVLEFKEAEKTLSLRRTIKLISTDEEGEYELERGLTANNHILDKRRIKGFEEVRALWIDAVVNGFILVKNEILMRGIKDVLGIAPGQKFEKVVFEDIPPPHTTTTSFEIPVDSEIRGGCAPISSSVNI